ncbi:MAG: 16S rRNA (cytosine(1402)-N(4))-methyltransferase RsmH, partial [Actinomycetota bacterium]|nr:16S rRNA (cytosine(1402)-N(4))-methyltransferase RsmH [Actinomycetota bacterium]
MGSLPVNKMRASTPPACHLVRSGRNPDERIFTGGLPISEKERSPQRMSSSSSANGYPLDPAAGSSGCRITRTAPDGYSHEPVMLTEVLDLLEPIPPGVFLDATVGGAGHSKALLEQRDDVHLIGIDQDQEAQVAATEALDHLYGRFDLIHGRFDQIDTILDRLGVEKISGALFDLGVSSHQLDTPARGFSFRKDGPLDMRMDRTTSLKAEDLVNNSDLFELSR